MKLKNSLLTSYSRTLRNNLTDAERAIWRNLRHKNIGGYKFRRQQIIGNYIVDFICFEQKLIIEIDGGQHNENIDRIRTKFLENEGYKILRFWNNDVLKNIDGVMRNINSVLQSNSPPSKPSPLKGEGI